MDTYPELIANVERSKRDWFRRSGIYPIHGLIVVKDEHIKRYPWLARSLMDAFVAAKKPYLEELKRGHGDSPEDKRYRRFPVADERSAALRHGGEPSPASRP